jgi:hypothetical protein
LNCPDSFSYSSFGIDIAYEYQRLLEFLREHSLGTRDAQLCRPDRNNKDEYAFLSEAETSFGDTITRDESELRTRKSYIVDLLNKVKAREAKPLQDDEKQKFAAVDERLTGIQKGAGSASLRNCPY